MSDWLSNKSFIYVIGFLAQILFATRLLLQWIKSEKSKRVLTPELFWELSLIASFLLFVYGWLRDDFAVMLGQILTYFIYIRNMQLQSSWKKLSILLRWFLSVFPLIVIYYSFNNNTYDLDRLFKNEAINTNLLIWGSLAQVVFIFRFIYQWFYSEKRKKSALPTGFWILSLIGSSMILSYAIIRKDPVLFVGQSFGFIVYSRNLMLSSKSQKST